MKSFLLMIVVSLFIGFSYQQSAFAAQQSISLWQTPLNILSGDSTTALMRYRLPGMENVTAISVRLAGYNGQQCPAMVRDVELEIQEGQRLQRFLLNDKNQIVLQRPGLLGFVVNFRNYQTYSVSCHIDVRGIFDARAPEQPEEPGNTPTPELSEKDFSFAGVLRYRGGFANSLIVPIHSVGKITHIWLRQPEYCDGLEVLALEFGKQGAYWVAAAHEQMKGAYSLPGGGVVGVDSVRLIANGPVDLHCDIPVYARNPESSGGEPFEP